jgi:hypothetical protein
MKKYSALGERLLWIGGTAIILAGAVYAYSIFSEVSDLQGWVPHTTAVDMFMEGDWLVGENRVCLGMHDAPPSARREHYYVGLSRIG